MKLNSAAVSTVFDTDSDTAAAVMGGNAVTILNLKV